MSQRLSDRMSCVLVLFCALLGDDSRSIAAEGAYTERIRPLLQKFCFECHGEQAEKSGLRLDTLSAVLSVMTFSTFVREFSPF
jgi:hypothetical protein